MSNETEVTEPPSKGATLLKACVFLAVSLKLFASLAASSPVVAVLAALLVIGCLIFLVSALINLIQ